MQASSDRLRELEEMLIVATKKVNEVSSNKSIKVSELETAKHELLSAERNLDLIKQQIMIEKKFIDATR